MKPTIPEIQQYLNEQQVTVTYQEETDQLYLLLAMHNRQVPVFIRVMPHSMLVQLVAFLPYQVAPASFNDVSRMLHALNKDIDAPGFCLNEDVQIVMYRLMLPVIGATLDEGLFSMYLNTLQKVVKDFLLNIEPVASGKITFEQILAKAQSR